MKKNNQLKVGFIASGDGEILNYVVKMVAKGLIKAKIKALFTDRTCGVLQKAKHWEGCKIINLNCPKEITSDEVSEQINNNIQSSEIDLICLAYNRLIKDPLLTRFKGKIINIHLSLLPSFPGFGGVQKALRMGVQIGGSTIHIVDETIDCGPPIVQSCIPITPNMNIKDYQQKLFNHLCKDLCQVIQWFADDRVKIIERDVFIKGAKYGTLPTNPKLEISFD